MYSFTEISTIIEGRGEEVPENLKLKPKKNNRKCESIYSLEKEAKNKRK